jgi:2-dehydro-3-deoxy-D-arabinonate dehydratase
VSFIHDDIPLARYIYQSVPRWACNGKFLPTNFNIKFLLELPKTIAISVLEETTSDIPASGRVIPPIEPGLEIWASGVTFLRSRDARMAEAQVQNVYDKVYFAERPEIFIKSIGARLLADNQSIRIRRDSTWNVPEPELVLVINSHKEILGYCVGNDVSSRSIEAENPLYLPQAKIYSGSCALGPWIDITRIECISQLSIQMDIFRKGYLEFHGETSIPNMKRSFEELIDYLFREQEFPHGVYLFTGTGIVPSDYFSLTVNDKVVITIGDLRLENIVSE